jgi:hypothetical protein
MQDEERDIAADGVRSTKGTQQRDREEREREISAKRSCVDLKRGVMGRAHWCDKQIWHRESMHLKHNWNTDR